MHLAERAENRSFEKACSRAIEQAADAGGVEFTDPVFRGMIYLTSA